ncbi:hypothetical protein [Metapseudomonas otitidis]|uniref:hypothetical protein n=1 Tax=Metapseudomonas otitidis TaxID=319939 RepID=UPI0013F65C2B|nr:hypothetical protein [Pseudomonas otitidis]
MQYAYCNLDSQTWEASRFALLPSGQLSNLRDSLICAECGALAWFRRASTHGHPAHFCAHHEPSCELKAEYVAVDDERGDGSEVVDQVQSSGDIVVRLSEDQGGPIDVPDRPNAPVGPEWAGGRSHQIRGRDLYSTQQFSLRRVLHRLVQSPDFRLSMNNISFFRPDGRPLIQGQVRNVTRAFSEITANDTEDAKFFWGPITSARRTDDGKIWLNSSPQYQSVSVAIFEDIAEDFLEAFGIDDLDDLAGAHVLVTGRCSLSGPRGIKPVIWCGALYQIVIRRYRAANLVTAG